MRQADKIEKALLEAIGAYQARRYAEAEVGTDRILRIEPRQAATLQLKALLAHLRGDCDAADTAVTASLAARPGHAATLKIAGQIASARFVAGHKAQEAGRTAEAIAALRRATVLDGKFTEAWFGLGLALQDAKDYVGAADAFGHVVALRPGDAKAQVNHAVSLQQTGDLNGALTSYRAAYAKDSSTFGAIAQSLAAASTGLVFLDAKRLRDRLTGA